MSTTNTKTTRRPRKAAATDPTPARAGTRKAAVPEPAAIIRAKSTVSKDGEITCRVCHRTMAVTKFPTTKNPAGEVVRVDRCRACRDAAAADRKATKTAPVRKARGRKAPTA
jgi:hypothetical protein